MIFVCIILAYSWDVMRHQHVLDSRQFVNVRKWDDFVSEGRWWIPFLAWPSRAWHSWYQFSHAEETNSLSYSRRTHDFRFYLERIDVCNHTDLSEINLCQFQILEKSKRPSTQQAETKVHLSRKLLQETQYSWLRLAISLT